MKYVVAVLLGLASATKLNQKTARFSAPVPKPVVDPVAAMFNECDSDGDGELTPMEAWNCTDAEDRREAAFLWMKNAGMDQKMDLSEFRKAYADHLAIQAGDLNVPGDFEAPSFVQTKRFGAAVPQAPVDPVKALFDSCDSDGDGEIGMLEAGKCGEDEDPKEMAFLWMKHAGMDQKMDLEEFRAAHRDHLAIQAGDSMMDVGLVQRRAVNLPIGGGNAAPVTPPAPAEPTPEQVFADCDTNADNTITWAEAESCIERNVDAADVDRELASGKALFAKHAGRDLQVNLDEFKAAWEEKDQDFSEYNALQFVLDNFDTNGDGKIAWEEVEGEIPADVGRLERAQLKTKFLKHAGADGKVDVQELEGAMQQLREEYPEVLGYDE